MKRLKGLFAVFGLLCTLVWGGQAHSYLPSEIVAMQDQARAGVEAALAQLEAANESGDPAMVSMAAKVLELAVTNYAAITEYLNSGASATDSNNIIGINSQAISSQINTFVAAMAAGNLAAAQASLAIIQTLATSLPDNFGAELLPGLADLGDRINAAVAAAATIIVNATTGGPEQPLLNQPASQI